MLRRGSIFATLLGGLFLAPFAWAETPPAPGLTKLKGEGAFLKAAIVNCLASLEDGESISAQTDAERGDLHPAAPEDRTPIQGAAPAWTTTTLGGHLVVWEPSADRCNVVADQLAVEDTFSLIAKMAPILHPPLEPVPVKSGYNSIVYQFEVVEGGQRYIVHLEGAEPGGLGHPLAMLQGHAYRFSLLQAWVVRQPAAATPPFR